MTENNDRASKQVAKLIALIGVLILITGGLLGYVWYLKYWTPTEEAYCATDAGELIDVMMAPNSMDASQLKGSQIFKLNCATCHTINGGKLTASDLAGVVDRVPSQEWLIEFITNSDSVYKSGDEYALHIWESAGNRYLMPGYKLSNAEMGDLISYLSAY